MKLSDLFDVDALEKHIQNGYVKKTLHPELPLGILNYTDKTTYEGLWDDVTRRCRGLIYRLGSGEVIASGPAKFFNYGEPAAKQYPLSQRVLATRKEDGSLGIEWHYDDNGGIATRGSFTSEQACHATNGEFFGTPLEHWGTRIYEIVYPENRIVMDYKGKDKNIFLGTVDNLTGLIDWRPYNSYVPREIMTLGDALALPIPEGEEGYVLDILDDDLNIIDHLKLKGEWYKTMHAAIFGLTEKRVWEAWHSDNSEFFESLPDELQPWALAVANRLDEEYSEWRLLIIEALNKMDDAIGKDAARSKQAGYILLHHKELSGAMFAELDMNFDRLVKWIEQKVKPGHVPYSSTTTEKELV